MKKLKNTDFLFVAALSSVMLIHIFFLFVVPFSQDEYFYVSIPFRLINGDSLVQHEWHLTQFSSLFSWLPVYIWTAIKSSTEGMFIFLRCVYLLIHTTIAVVIYRFFREYGKWAVMASMIFYVQIAYRIQAISYQSMFVIFLLLTTLCLLSIYKKNSVRFYVFAGICFGCCCVCNPLFCLVFLLYLVCCALWTKREILIKNIVKLKTSRKTNKDKKLTKRQKREQKQQVLNVFPNIESYNCFFTKEAIIYFTCGVIIIAVIAATFFFLTGGTINSIFDNIENLLGSSEYDIASQSIFSKFIETIKYFSIANLHMPWILPILFIALFFDNNRKQNKHRIVYLAISVLWSILFIVGVVKNFEIYLCAISLPFCVTSTICYILTENKNKKLFYCMYIPCLIATLFQYIAADTHWGAIGIVLAVSNVAGVFFAMDLCDEFRSDSTDGTEKAKGKTGIFRSIVVICFCLQILFYGIFYEYGQIYGKDSPKATNGPFSGMYMPKNHYNIYNQIMCDIDVIKNISYKNDPILLATNDHWMYLCLDRPISVYTTWYRGSLNPELLIRYYKENPDKIPKYIYFDAPDPENAYVDIVSDMFEFTRENLSRGVLLTVEGRKF